MQLKAENQTLIQDVKKKNCDIYSLTLEIEKNNNRKPENSESFKSTSSRFIQNPSSISSIGSLRSNTIPTESMAQTTDIVIVYFLNFAFIYLILNYVFFVATYSTSTS